MGLTISWLVSIATVSHSSSFYLVSLNCYVLLQNTISWLYMPWNTLRYVAVDSIMSIGKIFQDEFQMYPCSLTMSNSPVCSNSKLFAKVLSPKSAGNQNKAVAIQHRLEGNNATHVMAAGGGLQLMSWQQGWAAAGLSCG